ncbi:MAG: hypothetical protein EOL88_05290 [Bacteroidia bacterium]|nr:hypothetical protein [Bacteroidia bacterium]
MAKIVLLTSYDVICLGIRVLSSVLKDEGHDVTLIFFKKDSNAPIDLEKRNHSMYIHYLPGEIQGCNYDINPYTNKEESILRNLIKDISPDIIGLSTRTFWLDFGKDLMNQIRQDNPRAITLAGGYGPSIQPEEFAKQVDYIVFGEGETTLKEIANLVDKKNFDEIKEVNNIGMEDKKGSLHINSPYPPLKKLDEIPFPEWEDKQSYYIENNQLITDPALIRNINWYDLFGCRGCPSNCSYCMAGHWNKMYKHYGDIYFPKIRIRSPENVISELVYQNSTFGVSH